MQLIRQFELMAEEKYKMDGKIRGFFHAYIGQEAIAVGVTKALAPDEYILPMHRNLGVFTARNMPLNKLFMQLQGSYEGYSKGRERSFHFGSIEHHIIGMISHLGPQMGIADRQCQHLGGPRGAAAICHRHGVNGDIPLIKCGPDRVIALFAMH